MVEGQGRIQELAMGGAKTHYIDTYCNAYEYNA
jgi:hypothetical protein